MTVFRLATDATGLVQIIQHALMAPAAIFGIHVDGAAAQTGVQGAFWYVPRGLAERAVVVGQ